MFTSLYFQLPQRNTWKVQQKRPENDNSWRNNHHTSPKVVNNNDTFARIYDKINHPSLKKEKAKRWERKENKDRKLQSYNADWRICSKKILFKLLNHKFLLYSLRIPRLKTTAAYSNPSKIAYYNTEHQHTQEPIFSSIK